MSHTSHDDCPFRACIRNQQLSNESATPNPTQCRTHHTTTVPSEHAFATNNSAMRQRHPTQLNVAHITRRPSLQHVSNHRWPPPLITDERRPPQLPLTPRYVDVGRSEDVQSAMAAAAEDVNHSLARLEEFHGVVKQISGETDSFLRECVPALQVTCTAPAHPPSHKPTQRLTGGRVAAHPWPT
jgi:hypothetical protein